VLQREYSPKRSKTTGRGKMGNHTNFDTLRRPPDSLERFVAEMEKWQTVKRSGFFLTQDFDAIAEAADTDFYKAYAHRAGLRKFLWDLAVFLKDGNKCYVDFDRAGAVISACQNKKTPPDPIPSQKRLFELKAAKASTVPTQSEPAPSKPVHLLAQPEPPVAGLLPPPVQERATLKYVLFFTPIQMDAWLTLCVSSRQATIKNETRVAIATDHEQFFEDCASNTLNCSPEEYAETIQSFVAAGLISHVVGIFTEGKQALRFLVDYEECHLVAISERELASIEPSYLKLVREIQHDALGVVLDQQNVDVRLIEYAKSRYAQLDSEAVCLSVLVSDILYRHATTGRLLLSWPGFERVELRLGPEGLHDAEPVVADEDGAVLEEAQGEVSMPDPIQMSVEDLKALETSQTSFLELANDRLRRAQEELVLAQEEVQVREQDLEQTKLALKDYKRREREAIERELEAKRAHVAALEQQLAALDE